MRQRVLIMLLLLLGTGIAGCLDWSQSDACVEAECPTENPGDGEDRSPGGLGGIELPNGTVPAFQLRGCESVGVAIDVPNDELEKVVPSEFRLMSLAPGITANVQIEVTSCSDSLDNEGFFGPIRIYRALASVVPANESWSDRDLNRYVLDIASDSEDWNEAMERANLTFDRAEFEISKTGVPGDGFMSTVDVSSDTWETSFVFPYLDDREQILERSFHIWSGNGPFYRTSLTMEFDGRGVPNGGLLTHTGESTLSPTMPAPVTTYYLGTWRFDQDALFLYDGEWAS